jgi:BirA family biotin operon repressor/biotin-[acetyl-CoA-carboxylase] ligase
MFDSWEFDPSVPLFSKPQFQWSLTTDYVGRRLLYLPQVGSTMDLARRAAGRGYPSGAIVAAEEQVAGRGRAGRGWVSPPGVNLYLTLIFYADAPDLRRLAYLTPLAVALAIEETARQNGIDLRTDLKWPNDVLIGGRKVAGVLIETDVVNDRPAAFVGVGINVNLEVAAYPQIEAIATSLRAACGFAVSREALLATFCNRLEPLYDEARAGERGPFEQWRARLVTIGQEVTASGAAAPVAGRAVDVTEDGALLIETSDGRRVRVDAGDVSLTGT